MHLLATARWIPVNRTEMQFVCNGLVMRLNRISCIQAHLIEGIRLIDLCGKHQSAFIEHFIDCLLGVITHFILATDYFALIRYCD